MPLHRATEPSQRPSCGNDHALLLACAVAFIWISGRTSMRKGGLEAFSDGVIAIRSPPMSQSIYVLVGLLWVAADRRIESVVSNANE